MRTVSRLSAVDCKNPQHVFSLSYTLVRTVYHQPNHRSSLSEVLTVKRGIFLLQLPWPGGLAVAVWRWQAASRVVVMWLTGVVNRESDASPACPTAACAGRVTASRIDGSATQSRTLHLYTALQSPCTTLTDITRGEIKLQSCDFPKKEWWGRKKLQI